MNPSPGDVEEAPEAKTGLITRLLAFIGLRFKPEPGQWIVATKRFPFVVIVAAVVGTIALGGGIYYTSTPGFCKVCHYIRPYVESWEVSTHKDVTCSKCHFPPGLLGYIQAKMDGTTELIKTITGTHGPRPHAEIADASCLREGCHETRLLDGKVLFKDKYPFDHTPHLTKLRRGKKLRCTSCHSQIVQGDHITVTESVCFTCHFKGQRHGQAIEPIGGCLSCHEVATEGIELADGSTFEHKPFVDRGVACWKCHFDSTRGTGDVPKQVCIECHGEAEKLAHYDDSEVVHNWHVTERKIECFQCHSEIRHGLHLEPVSGAGDCATCHSLGGHSLQDAMFAGTGGQGVQDSPSMHHVANVDCVACHEAAESDQIAEGPAAMFSPKVKEEACKSCHGERIKGKLSEWREIIDEMVVEATADLSKAREAVGAMAEDAEGYADAHELLERAQHNCDFVANAKAGHNPDYALELLDKVSDDVAKAIGIARR